MKGFATVLFAGAALFASPTQGHEANATPAVAIRFLSLFDRLRDAAMHPVGVIPPHVAFQFSDTEMNDYLRYALRTAPRPGVEAVTVKIFPYNYISTFVVVDFDVLEQWKPGTIPPLLRPVLNGKKSVWVDYRFQTSSSRLTFSVEKAYYRNVRLPAFIVERMIHIVAARQPEKYDTGKPLPLPFGLTQIRTIDHILMGEN